jgi:SAM-dependent methyltransferase
MVTDEHSKSEDEWTSRQHALWYLQRADSVPHRTEGERVLLDHVPLSVKTILDLGTGDGRLLALLRIDRPRIKAVALDFSQPMIEMARKRFADDPLIRVIAHDLNNPIPKLGYFDAVVSSFAIHHLPHERKQSLYIEVFDLLNPAGVFCNLEHVSSPSRKTHEKFLHEIGRTIETEDRSNKLLDVETQLKWLRHDGFIDVDCYWKWLELALLIGVKPM